MALQVIVVTFITIFLHLLKTEGTWTTLTVTESASELSVVNTWNSGTEGYNFTILQSAMVIDRLYDYEIGDWVWDSGQEDYDSQGLDA